NWPATSPSICEISSGFTKPSISLGLTNSSTGVARVPVLQLLPKTQTIPELIGRTETPSELNDLNGN
ncbi:MAG: hypothetical protein VXW83_04940, partial [SAR324 cluster bacterium]|nr:hypothetical protein [SAR324 cluster bacterium]